MTREQKITAAYKAAAECYAEQGVDTAMALERLQQLSISLPCWQADDVKGFELSEQSLSGGIQVTGNYPGRARNMDELRQDIAQLRRLIPGKHRLSLHAIYGDFQGRAIDRDQIEPAHFQSWIDWAADTEMKLDFNSTSFSHPKSGNLSLSHPDKNIRDFWIEHTRRCRQIASEIGRQLNDTCLMNLWVHDGSKEVPANRMRYRQWLRESLDAVYAGDYPHMKDCLESKLFGIGLESYTVGSHDFYLSYCLKNNKIITLDTGHFHLTESIADKVSSLLLFLPGLMLHVSRPVRWDSDHVVTLSDELCDLMRELVRCRALDRVYVGLDYFDATINRIGAYVSGSRAVQKALLLALLEAEGQLTALEDNNRLFERLAWQEEAKAMPWGAVYDYFCLTQNVPVGKQYIEMVGAYEKEVLSRRG